MEIYSACERIVIDLKDFRNLSEQNDGFKYLLMAIDHFT